ncbi:magnesium transporter [Rufibacter glacialis]|uniref:Magnesium transporter MgtE n=1 Tax=Rufibacter glacialis TaxID=1259555 RepID=A0A5M8QIP3_9BACT|nr:magnesium transporter [Rufibacter glacialis]KAA6434656.1 magnesium transporter [Rufibacter glacialis]GGK71397.1 magnesium transporter MgtE [Rufibacter glacialis]
MPSEITREFIDQIEDAIERRDAEFILSNMEEMYPVDITTVLYELNTEQSKYVMDVLPAEVGAEILSDLDSDVRASFLKNFTIEEIARYIGEMDSDDAVDLLNEQPVQRKEEIIAQLEDQEHVADIIELLHYDEDCAGGLMAKELIKVNINWRVGQCTEEIRRQAENVEKVYAIYVVDDRDKLVGRLGMKTLLLSNDQTPISQIYEADVISIESFKSDQEVAAVMQKYDLEAIPVVNIQGRLLGRITIDDVIDVIQEQAELSRQLMTGITENIEEDDSVFRLSRARLPWLMVGMVGGLLGARFIGLFEGDIAIIPALAMFTPLITATGGNVGIQSSSIIIQTLANKTIMFDNFTSRIIKVLLVAVINGLVMSGLVLGFNILFGVQLTLSLVVAVALFSVVLLSSFMGTVTPMILDKYGVNPAVAAGPFITTANDLLGLGVYFLVAHLLLNL